MRGLAVGILLFGVIMSCSHAPNLVGVTRQDKMTTIINLWTQIRGWRHDAHMDLDPTRATEQQVQFKQLDEIKKHVCPDTHAIPPTCGDVCGLADAICDNAESICNLADELGKNDEMAQEKCTSAKASCRESRQRCCNCSKNPPSEAPPSALPLTPMPAPAGAKP